MATVIGAVAPGSTVSPRTTVRTIVPTGYETIVFGAPRFADVPQCRTSGLYVCMTPTTSTPTSPHPDAMLPQRTLLVDVMQAARMLSLSRSSIYQLIWNEELIPVRIGRSVRFSVEQLEQFVTDRIAENAR